MTIELQRDHHLHGKISYSNIENIHLTVSLYKDDPEVKEYFSCCQCDQRLARLVPHAPVIASITNSKISDYVISSHNIDKMLFSLHTGQIACMECLETYLDEEQILEVHLEQLPC
tara:strand:- start:131 stop:475 length:345 start_codon:yes stop_codon:yes gene_type:complete